jgi:hypothetical protein
VSESRPAPYWRNNLPAGQTLELESLLTYIIQIVIRGRVSVDLEPFESEHEGYTGNAGNTVEHWYHRAAVDRER